MTLIASAMWLLSGRGNKHAHTHARTLFCELHWQALIPALAYERRQLEAVAVASVAANTCCGFHSDGSSSLTFTLTFAATLLRCANLVLIPFFGMCFFL